MPHDKSIYNLLLKLPMSLDEKKKKKEGKYTYMMYYPEYFLCAYCVTE